MHVAHEGPGTSSNRDQPGIGLEGPSDPHLEPRSELDVDQGIYPPSHYHGNWEGVPSKGNSSSRYLPTGAMLVGGRVTELPSPFDFTYLHIDKHAT